MDQEKALTVTRSPWQDDAGAALTAAARGELPEIRAQVRAGVAILWRVSGASVGWLVTRQEGGELVIVLGAGSNCRAVIRHVLQKARAAGLTVRTHIDRPGLKRIYEREGFRLREWVMGA